MGFDERRRVLSGELHCPQGAYYPVFADTLIETGDVFVECVEQCIIFAAESLIGVLCKQSVASAERRTISAVTNASRSARCW